MNAAQFHLALNHLPILLVPLGSVFLSIGLLKKSKELRLAGLALFIGAGLFALPVYFTGEPAGELIGNRPSVSRALLHEHEASAQYSILALEALAVLSILWWIAARFQRAPSLPLWWGLVLISLTSSAILLRTAYLGGQIRHEELRSTAPNETPPLYEGSFDEGQEEEAESGEDATGI